MSALAVDPEPCIEAVGIVVPARDEQDHIEACLTSVRRSVAALPDGIDVAVAVVLDRCTDATPERVAGLLDGWPQAIALTVDSRPGAGFGVGGLRNRGLREVLARLSGHLPAATWLLSTDADTTVPPDWVRAHLGLAADGVHAVAGLADLGSPEHLATDALVRYSAIVDHGIRGNTHRHVYAANLGVRADAYLAVDGFPTAGAGEDHGLWHRLRAAGYTVAQPVELRVRTSARLRGRAADGLADLLRSLHPATAPRPEPAG